MTQANIGLSMKKFDMAGGYPLAAGCFGAVAAGVLGGAAPAAASGCHGTALAGALSEHNNPRTTWRSLNLQDLDARLQPAVEAVTDKNLTDDERWDAVVRANVLNTMRTIREQSPELWQMEQDETLKIVGGVYHLDTGAVEWLKE